MAQNVGRPTGAPVDANPAVQGGEFFTLAEELRAFRTGPLSDGPSDRALARAAGVSPTTVGDWLRGRRFPQDVDKVLAVVRMVRREAEARGVYISGGSLVGLLNEDHWRAAHQVEARRRASLVSQAVQHAQAASVLTRQAGRPLSEVGDPFALEVHRPLQPDQLQPGLPSLPAYVPREHDIALQQVAEAAAEGRSGIAVLVGGSATGKTRACWEALALLRNQDDGWRVWHPVDPARPDAALRELATVGPRTVVWLNEAQFYLDVPDGLGEKIAAGLRELLRDPARAPVLVLATMWPQYWETLTIRPETDPDRHAQARELLAGHDIAVPAAFTPEQLHQLEQAGDGRLAQAAAAPDGQVIQFLAGAPELLARYRNASPAPAALINAAMDARRLGMSTALPHAFLEAAAPAYLTDAEWDALDEDWLEQALAYVAVPCKGVRGPLTRIRPRGIARVARLGSQGSDKPVDSGQGSVPAPPLYRLADYLDQYGRRHRENQLPPASFWEAIAEHASPADQAALGNAAQGLGLYRYASQLRESAIAHISLDDPDAVAGLLDSLRAAGAEEQVTALATRAAASIPLDDPDDVTRLLDSLRAAGAEEQVTALLCRNPATCVALDDPDAVAGLLDSLRAAGAEEQVTALATRAAASIPLDDPDDVTRLLDSLRAAGAEEQVTALATRAAASIPLDDPDDVTRLLDSLRAAGAEEQVTALATRAAAQPRGNTGLLTRRDRSDSPLSAVEAFYRTHYPGLLAHAMYIGVTREDAEDAVEAVIITMLPKWGEIQHPYHYARTAVTNELLKLRSRSRLAGRRMLESGMVASDRDQDLKQQNQLTMWEDRQWVTQILSSLPPRQRETLAYIIDEFSPSEIALLLGRDPAAVRQNLMDARRRLKSTLPKQISSA